MPSAGPKIVVSQDQTRPGTWMWELIHRKEVIAQSARTWEAKHHAKRAAETVQKHMPAASITVEG